MDLTNDIKSTAMLFDPQPDGNSPSIGWGFKNPSNRFPLNSLRTYDGESFC